MACTLPSPLPLPSRSFGWCMALTGVAPLHCTALHCTAHSELLPTELGLPRTPISAGGLAVTSA
jgi:hypothetical protein